MRRVKKVNKVKTAYRVGLGDHVSVIASLRGMGYSEDEAKELLATGRVLQRVGPRQKLLHTDSELYILDPKEEIIKPDEFVDRGHLVDLE